MDVIDFIGKRFAITGKLPIVRSAAAALLESRGGIYQPRVTRDTDYLIVGELRKLSHKVERAQKLQQAGHRVKTIDGGALFPENTY